MSQQERYGMSVEGIQALVDRFYEKVQADADLSPIFVAAIGSESSHWRPHLDKMYSFWGTIMMGAGDYVGNPLQKHREVPPFPEQFFERWLGLFAETADELLEPEVAFLFKYKSQKMAAVLRRGLYP